MILACFPPVFTLGLDFSVQRKISVGFFFLFFYVRSACLRVCTVKLDPIRVAAFVWPYSAHRPSESSIYQSVGRYKI